MDWIERTAEMQTDEDIKEALNWIHAIPNGHNRNHIWRTIARLEGVKKGVSDTFTPYPAQGYHGFYIEMKRRGETPTEDQVRFGMFVARMGFKFEWYDSWILAARALVSYFELIRYFPIPEFIEDDVLLHRRADAKAVVKAHKKEVKTRKKPCKTVTA